MRFSASILVLAGLMAVTSGARGEGGQQTETKVTPEATVPGASVTIEGGVRVLRPASPANFHFEAAPAKPPSAIIYRGAAFYHAPDPLPPPSGSAPGARRAD